MVRAALAALLLSLPVVGVAGEFQTIRETTVQIRGDKGSCSAVVVSPTRLLTAKHCLGAMSEELGFFAVDGGLRARVIAVSDISDLMLLELKGGAFKKVATVCPKPSQIDDRVWNVGYPLGGPQVVTEGHWQHPDGIVTAQAIFGNSGGGTYSKQEGKFCLTGIVSAGASAKGQFVYHLIFTVPQEEIVRFLDESKQSSAQSRKTNASSFGLYGPWKLRPRIRPY